MPVTEREAENCKSSNLEDEAVRKAIYLSVRTEGMGTGDGEESNQYMQCW